ncbi:MAG: 4Fe-4S binding protein, partial [Caldilineaceae bacterium]|nr:4Fe-4S binding protein [Caldilineaceae bacterium]
ALMVVDGLLGSPLAAKNTATVAAWVHYRGFVVLALLLVGNLFCAACPFMLPRTLAKWLGRPTARWPRVLRNKWLAVGALIAIVYSYELFDLWASPWWTAWLIVAYFAVAFVIEALFTRSSFCMYVCPLGTFNFLYSTVSPTKISARSTDVCRTCVGHDCINGNAAQQGCQLELYVPTLRSNLDCTLCL